jgi:hypothetical protein
VEAVRNVLPERFNWWLFSLALACMAAPILMQIRQLAIDRSSTAMSPDAAKPGRSAWSAGMEQL